MLTHLVKLSSLLALPTIALTVLPHLTPATAYQATSKTAPSISAPALIAQQSRVKRIRFAPGESSATIKDAVIRGTRDIYLVNARQGQTMTVKISSIEKNAEFDITAPPNKVGQRRTLRAGVVSWTGTLPKTGDYQVVIGSARGNATYRLQVTIK